MSAISAALRVLPVPHDPSLEVDPFEARLVTIFVDGVPERFIGRRFRLDDEVSILGSQRMLRFGTSGLSNAIAVDLDTGHVVEVLDVPGLRSIFINSSLQKFVQTLEAVAERFPFYDTDSDDEEVEAVSSELLQIIQAIDPPAAGPDRYWSTFVDDAGIGDLTTEAILAVEDLA